MMPVNGKLLSTVGLIAVVTAVAAASMWFGSIDAEVRAMNAAILESNRVIERLREDGSALLKYNEAVIKDLRIEVRELKEEIRFLRKELREAR